MEFIELAKSRYSVRSFSTRQIEEEKLNKILEVAKISPTAVNKQPQKIMCCKANKHYSKSVQFANVFLEHQLFF